jgi:hypothetical protein
MNGHENDDTWTPLPFENALSGHLMVGVIGGAMALVLLAGSMWVGLTPGVSVGTLFGGVVVGWLIVSFVGTLIERRYSIARRHDSPGSWSKTAWLAVLNIPAGAVAGLIIGTGDPSWTLAGLGAFFIGYGVDLAFIADPWKDGMTRGEFREKWQDTKRMTSRVLDDDSDGGHSRSTKDP